MYSLIFPYITYIWIPLTEEIRISELRPSEFSRRISRSMSDPTKILRSLRENSSSRNSPSRSSSVSGFYWMRFLPAGSTSACVWFKDSCVFPYLPLYSLTLHYIFKKFPYTPLGSSWNDLRIHMQRFKDSCVFPYIPLYYLTLHYICKFCLILP